MFEFLKISLLLESNFELILRANINLRNKLDKNVIFNNFMHFLCFSIRLV